MLPEAEDHACTTCLVILQSEVKENPLHIGLNSPSKVVLNYPPCEEIPNGPLEFPRIIFLYGPRADLQFNIRSAPHVGLDLEPEK